MIRQAALCDFMRSDRPMRDDFVLEGTSYRRAIAREAAGREGGVSTLQKMWMMHTREFLQEEMQPQPDMWHDWAI